MKLKDACILGALLISTSVSAQQFSPSRWDSSQLSTVITVRATTDANVYHVSTVVTDLQTSQVIARPALLVGASQPASFEMGTKPGSVLKVVVNVDADGQTANYRSEMILDGRIVSSHADSLRVKRGA